MPYPYGTQNAPVVGNGLGGLPRRSSAAATATTSSLFSKRVTAITGQFSATATRLQSYSSNPQYASPIVFNNRIILPYAYDAGSGLVYETAVANLNTDGSLNGVFTSYAMPSGTQSAFAFGGGSAGAPPSPTYVINDTNVLILNGSRVNGLQLNANGSIASYTIFTVPSSGTYVNGGTWTSLSTSGLGSHRTCVVDGGRVIVTRLDTTNLWISFFVFDLNGNFISGMKGGAYNTTAYLGSIPMLWKAPFGYLFAWTEPSSAGAGGNYTILRAFSINPAVTAVIQDESTYIWSTDNSGAQNTTPAMIGTYYSYVNNAVLFLQYDSSSANAVISSFPYSSTGFKLMTSSPTVNATTDFPMSSSGNSAQILGALNVQINSQCLMTGADSLRPLAAVRSMGKPNTTNSFATISNKFCVSTPSYATSQEQYAKGCLVSLDFETSAVIASSSVSIVPQALNSPDLSVIATCEVAASTAPKLYWLKGTVTG
jgi:hypothetical protein